MRETINAMRGVMEKSIFGNSIMRNTLLLLIFSTIGLLCHAQQEQIHFKRISLREGLSQSMGKCSYKDKQGYMWFGTLDGLNRYDGYEMTVFRNDPKNPASVSSNFINDIQEDQAGNLWVATTEGIDRFDRQKEIFIHYPLGDEPSSYIVDIFQDNQGTLWVVTPDVLFRWEKGQFRAYPTSFNIGGLRNVTVDDQGDFWLVSWGNLKRFNPRNKQVSDYQINSCKVIQDSHGRLWVGAYQGLFLYNRQTDSFTRFVHEENNPNSLSRTEVLALAEGTDGRLWIGTQNGGISLFDYRQNRFSTLRQNIDDPTSLSNNTVHTFYRDDQGNMWAGTWAGGFNLYSPYAAKFVHYQKILDFNNPNMNAVTGDSQGRIWIGIEDGGLVMFDRRTGKFTHYPNTLQQGVATDVIFSLVDYSRDSLAIGYSIASFAFFNKRTGKFNHFFPDPARPNGLSGKIKTIVFQDGDHNVWMGDWGGGLSFYDHRSRQFTSYHSDSKDTASLNNNVVFAICEDRQANLWVGTDGGLNHFDRSSGKFVRYQHDEKNPHSLSHNTINTLLVDHQGRLWVGTMGGLNRLDEKTNRFIHYGIKDGLPNEVIKAILEDEKGNLWLGTNKGLSRFNLQQHTFRNFDVNDGLQVEEFNRNACYKAADGTLFFAGTTGINMFHPDSLRENPYIPPVVITDFQIFNKSANLTDKDSPLQQSITQTKELTLSYKQSVFTFEFAALNFILPGKNQYAYKLEGFDEDWNQVGTQRKATYTNLDPGEYVFKVKASNNDGVWNEQGTSIKVIITPPFWQTWWFRLGVTLAILGSAFTFYQIRINAIQAQKAKLEEQVLERTAEVMQQKEELEAQTESLQIINADMQEKQEEILQQQEELQATAEQLQTINDELKESQIEIEIQHNSLRKANEQVMSSILYANTIYHALLPSEKKISQTLPEHFVLYRPKDIVSGDFYWFSHLSKEDLEGEENDLVFIAVVDCTGHGVPGAFMSIIGNTLLNEIINFKHILDPAEILEQLDKGVKSAIDKAEGVNTAGMDVCLMRMQKGEGGQVRVLYAGAKRPLFYVLNQHQAVNILSADRRSIGGQYTTERPFTTKELIVEKGTTFYLATDGYTDQNNPDRIKLGTPRLKEVISQVVFLPLSEQKVAFDEVLDEHQQAADQRDDITLIGVKV
ncbi:two-component regulator propeller domain-containing protein [Ohtaekwangia koreensis]|uniref:Ligand-binding sensor domain-containing protein n=1 Tax=Ohtaekwangia koreensis TaxID=688867 RepID=A0A1T5KJ24_9BACT|nr:two-component regulator propeller domain-containing protein [Ohtaekwangia koreensis]SKC63445.1 ligand-binding sensor domain-containing protein [Ohtaekwangia koreensis]